MGIDYSSTVIYGFEIPVPEGEDNPEGHAYEVLAGLGMEGTNLQVAMSYDAWSGEHFGTFIGVRCGGSSGRGSAGVSKLNVDEADREAVFSASLEVEGSGEPGYFLLRSVY